MATEWERATPIEAGFAADVGERLDAAVARGELVNLHAVIVARRGKLAVERYYAGADERRGQPLGHVVFGPAVRHDLRSISKSVVGLLYGIALAEGKAPALERPILDSFPALADLAADSRRRRLTIAHALTMTLGTQWDEWSLPYIDARNSEIAMEMAPDRYRFALDRPLVAEPGAGWTYNGGATAILGHLIAQGAGIPLDEFARAKLLAPLGITDSEWIPGSNGEPAAASGLRLRPSDLAKIGQLVLDRGRWGGRQIVPEAWLDQSFMPRAAVGDGLEYGYHWFLRRGAGDGQLSIMALGNGGQNLSIIPGRSLVVVVLAGNYNAPDAWKLPVAIMSRFVIAALRGG